MPSPCSFQLPNVLKFLTGLLMVRVVLSVVVRYVDYVPPNFESDFLTGREGYFWGGYHWAFYFHLAGGPLTLILGLILINDRFRQRLPRWHRILGRVQVCVVLLVIVPSGLWMASRAAAGPVAGMGFAMLAVVTGVAVVQGWRTAVQRRFAAHRRWMWRCFLMLCSTVVLRLIVGFSIVTGLEGQWVAVFAAWGSWFVPLAVFEMTGIANGLLRHPSNRPDPAVPR